MYKRILAATLCLLMIVALMACKGGDVPAATTIPTTTADVTTLGGTPEVTTAAEDLKTAELTEYLSSVAYRDFELTGSSEPYFMGRWFEKDIDGVRHMVTVTSGSHFYVLTDGATSLTVDFTVITSNTTPYFAYSIDGGETVRQLITEPTVTLPDAKPHTVRIIADGMYELESKWVDERGFALKSVTASEGGAIYGIKPKDKIVFYYGDSITEGIYALGDGAQNNSATNSFTWYSAEKLGITPYFIGYGGTGFTQGVDEGKSFATMIQAIDYNSKDRLVEDGIVPDVIVISHGTNEYWTNPGVFMSAAKEAINRLNEKYPNTPIIYLGHYNQHNNKNAFCESVANAYDNVYWVSSETWEITFTDNCHPNVAGAKKLGNNLADAMIAILGEEFFK